MADQDDADSLSRYSDPWKSRFDTITAMDPTLTQGLGDLSPNVKQHFAEELPTLLRDQRPWASNCQIDGGIKQVFFHHPRDVFYNLLVRQDEPIRTRLLLQAAEDVIDPRIEAALASHTGKLAEFKRTRLENEATSTICVSSMQRGGTFGHSAFSRAPFAYKSVFKRSQTHLIHYLNLGIECGNTPTPQR